MSRRIEGKGTIKRADEYEHINTTILPFERTIQAVGYYNRRKKELKVNPSNEVIINLTNRNAERTDLKNHIETLFKSSKNIDPYISNYIKEIRVEPVINDNKFINFNEELYPLNEDEKVKVVEERYFPIQNYYNYIYDLQLKKQIFRFVNETDNKTTQVAIENKNREKQVRFEEEVKVKSEYCNELGIADIIEQKHIIKDKKIKGFYGSRFDSKIKTERESSTLPVKELVPRLEHSGIPSKSNLVFIVNQNTRMQLSRKG